MSLDAFDDNWPTTRRYPRKTMEAFPCNAREALSIERFKVTRWIDRLAWLIAFALFVGLITSPRWWFWL